MNDHAEKVEAVKAKSARIVALMCSVKDRVRSGENESAIRAALLAEGYDAAEVEEALSLVAEEQGELERNALLAALFQITQTPGLSTSEKRKQISATVRDFLLKRGRFFFHAEHKDFSTAMFFDARRKLLLQLASDQFQSWFSDFVGINRTDRLFQWLFADIEDTALTSDNTTGLLPEMFWAARPSAIYLSNGDGHAVKITAGRVQLVDNGTDNVLFPAGLTLRPWKMVESRDPFATCRLFSDARFSAEHGLDLLRLYAISLPTNPRCKPPLCPSGAIGSGKTKLAVGLFELFGLTPRVSAIIKNGEDDFWTELNGGGLVCFDNADTRIDWLPDALAAAATDVSREKRQLYTDSTIIQQRARAWVVITSSNPTFASDPGLADRVLVMRLERRTNETAESALSDEIARNRDAGLSWIAQILSKALADEEPVIGNLNRRHPDFAAFAVKIGRAIGREQEAIAALQAAESDKSQFNLENDDLGAALIEFMAERKSFRGTAAELHEALKNSGIGFDADYWTTKRIGKRLAKLWPHIEGMFQGKVIRDTHSKQAVYQFAEFAVFERPFSGKSLREREYRSFPKTPLEIPQTPQELSAKDDFEWLGSRIKAGEVEVNG